MFPGVSRGVLPGSSLAPRYPFAVRSGWGRAEAFVSICGQFAPIDGDCPFNRLERLRTLSPMQEAGNRSDIWGAAAPDAVRPTRSVPRGTRAQAGRAATNRKWTTAFRPRGLFEEQLEA